MSNTITLPPTGKARVKSILSGDTAVLVGSVGTPPPEVLFTLDGIMAPRWVLLLIQQCLSHAHALSTIE